MTDIDNLRLLAAARAADDPMGAYALDGCADEIERLRAAIAAAREKLGASLFTNSEHSQAIHILEKAQKKPD